MMQGNVVEWFWDWVNFIPYKLFTIFNDERSEIHQQLDYLEVISLSSTFSERISILKNLIVSTIYIYTPCHIKYFLYNHLVCVICDTNIIILVDFKWKQYNMHQEIIIFRSKNPLKSWFESVVRASFRIFSEVVTIFYFAWCLTQEACILSSSNANMLQSWILNSHAWLGLDWAVWGNRKTDKVMIGGEYNR